jgi:hypothetical protein
MGEKFLPTPWNELEAGMGLIRNLPILLVKDPSIDSGIFDEKLSECFVSTISTVDDIGNLDANAEYQTWLSLIK